jgi:hypothetical protein
VGPLAIAQLFLRDDAANKYPKEHREYLADLLLEFEKLLGFGIRLNKVSFSLSKERICV